MNDDDKKEIRVLSWGGGTQSTALMLKFLDGEIKDEDNKPIILDYIMFADTGNEAQMVYNQIFKVIKHVKETHNKEIVVTKKNKELKSYDEIVTLIKSGLKYRGSKYADLYQSHLLFFRGDIKSIDVMPFWTRNKKTGSVGKTMTKACTVSYKINQIMRELRILEGVSQFRQKKHKIIMYIGFTIDEISRVKPSQISYAENKFPLVDMRLSKQDCIDYVKQKLGFKPQSSVCNMCYANDFNRVYNIYESDKDGWRKLIDLDVAMRDKPESHNLKDDVFMFKWQADENIRLVDINMEEMKEKLRKKYHQMSIFELEQEMACMGGCFI